MERSAVTHRTQVDQSDPNFDPRSDPNRRPSSSTFPVSALNLVSYCPGRSPDPSFSPVLVSALIPVASSPGQSLVYSSYHSHNYSLHPSTKPSLVFTCGSYLDFSPDSNFGLSTKFSPVPARVLF